MRFEEFAAARLPALLRYAMLLSGDHDQARDIVREVLTRSLVKWERIQRTGEPYAYARRLVTDEYLSWRRHKKPAAGDGLWKLLGDLPKRQRAALVLRFYEGLSDQEIAEALGCRTSTVRGYVSRALTELGIEFPAGAPEEVLP
ncbi:SigE family RNA polymerase sigma factor [Winogradskya consettensis]|uniref:RNA polymerase n=1 Tax=Winogradskya consettensis TaxID=113560 RepID=A0A919S722_9ACTN|nr:sigma factor-like helix-turn-helix DNA-binding protein [Actinoplanes consettensis]GIM66190.1 RNA polymerase [Actinoplanes consettensis]